MVLTTGTAREQWADAGIELYLGRITAEFLEDERVEPLFDLGA